MNCAAEVRFIEVRGWFSNKWFGFGGKYLGALTYRWTDDLRIPPVHPNRVISEIAYVRCGEVWSHIRREALHIYQHSACNLVEARSLRACLLPGTVAIWLGVSEEDPTRTAVMVYAHTADGPAGWYAALHGNTFVDLTNITRPQLDAIIAAGMA